MTAPVLTVPRLQNHPYVRCGDGHALRDLFAPDAPRSMCRKDATFDLRAPFGLAHACDEHVAAAVRRLVEASGGES